MRCPAMIGPVIIGTPALSPIIQIGQAPGEREGSSVAPLRGRPARPCSAGTGRSASKRRGFASASTWRRSVAAFRARTQRVATGCRHGRDRQLRIMDERRDRTAAAAADHPGRKAGDRAADAGEQAQDVIGRQHAVAINGRPIDVIPLPHPSGASTWHRVEPGKTLLQDALDLIADTRPGPRFCTVESAIEAAYRQRH